MEARDEALSRLDEHMPEDHTRKDFNTTNRGNTLKNLEDDLDPDELKELQRAAEDASKARNDINQTTARIGEVGGEKYLDEHPDYEIAGEEFRTRPGETPPGGWSDSAALKTDGSEFDIAEYKGGDATPSRSPVSTEFEGPARQGDPAYSRDHLLKDPRFAQYFHDHPDLWDSIKRGDTDLNFKVISTRTPDGPPHVRDYPFTLTTDNGGSEVLDALQAKIDALDNTPHTPNAPDSPGDTAGPHNPEPDAPEPHNSAHGEDGQPDSAAHNENDDNQSDGAGGRRHTDDDSDQN